jgi:hypothetical protein
VLSDNPITSQIIDESPVFPKGVIEFDKGGFFIGGKGNVHI